MSYVIKIYSMTAKAYRDRVLTPDVNKTLCHSDGRMAGQK